MKTALGEMEFKTGWKCRGEIKFFGKAWRVIFKAKAYGMEDGVTEAQKKAFNNFKDNGEALLLEAEKLFSLDDKNRYTPKTVLFERNGDVALLLDDNKDPDDGMVAILSPNMQLLSQDDYL